jgi:hypothetical protein
MIRWKLRLCGVIAVALSVVMGVTGWALIGVGAGAIIMVASDFHWDDQKGGEK